jgi:hypothetical protein
MDDSRKERLAEFVAYVDAHITGDEKGEAQVYLDRLFRAFGQKGVREAGATLEMRVKRDDRKGAAFADCVWKPHVLIEMKKRGEDLQKHYRQAFDYWTRLVPNRPRYVVLCNFDEFRVYDFETQMDTPVDTVQLAELPDRFGPFAFMFPTGETPVFGNHHEQVTRATADFLAQCFNSLVARKIDRQLAQRFTLQMLVALFAEDIGLMEQYTVAKALADCDSPQKAYDLIGTLFVEMNTPGKTAGGRFKGVDYFNGGLFAEPARVELDRNEVALLVKAADSNWSKVRPEIFGAIFEHSVEKEARHAYGAHFTHPVDIMKIVGPTIVEPWRELIENAKTLKRLRELRERLQRYTVLDPACGSGNFLYIAYRELKRVEARLLERMNEISTEKDKSQRQFGFVTARQFYGLDINLFAVELSKVTMMIARKLAIDELHINEPALPLDNLDANFRAADALIDANGERTIWPKVDVIIGNPPFLGAKRLKPERGADYVNAVRAAYPEVPGMADYCVYWIRRTHDLLPDCTPDDPVTGRGGLVGTQNIRNNKSRVGGLDHVVADGTIIEAVENQPWSGEANVHVSIANWVKSQNAALLPDARRLWFKVDAPKGAKKTKRPKGSGPRHKEYELSYRDCDHINSALSDQTDLSAKRPLKCNKKPKRCFQGKIPGYDNFLLDEAQANQLRHDSAAVVFPYLTGRELLDPFRIERWAIDFGNLDMMSAASYPSAFSHCKMRVLPAVQAALEAAKSTGSDMVKARAEHLERWWQFWNRRDAMTAKLKSLSRFVGCSRVTRRPIAAFLSTAICPSDLVQVFAFDDDYSFGVLQSEPHFEWFRKSSRLKVETDTRYSVREVFECFPWPQAPGVEQVDAVAEAGREVRRVRDDALKQVKGGLRAVYRTLELPGKNPLKDVHAALDAAVMAAYGFSPKRDLLAQLLKLNLDVAARIDAGEPVTAPGVPPTYPDPARLVTDDCIKP